MIKKLVKIQKELKAPKNQRNTFGKYNYRSCEDILEAVKPLANRENCVVTVSDEVVIVGDRIYVKATAMIKDAESDSLSTTAFAREPEQQKGMNEAQITGSASSYARKYALNGLFAIDDTKDADATNNHGKVTTKKGLPTLPKEGKLFDGVKSALGGKYTMADIEKKYVVTEEVKQLLTK